MIKQDIYSDSWCDIVFEDRNKEYGAYVLRKRDQKTTTIAILISVAAFVLAFSLPTIIKWLTPEEEVPVDTSFVVETQLIDAPPLENKPPPPPVEPPPPLKSTIKFIPPKVVKDEEAEDPPPAQNELENKDAAQKTEEGDSLGVDMSLGTNELVEEDPNKVFDWVSIEQKPEYPGGEKELMTYISKNIQYPRMEKENGVSGTVYLSFVIDKDGKVTDVAVARGVAGGKGLDAEALRVVKSMPAWKPGKQNGNPVRVKYSLPVKFVLK